MMDGKNIATQFLVIDLLEEILSLASNPGECGEFITTKIRELVGVKIVALMQAPVIKSQQKYSIISICPRRHEKTIKRTEINDLCLLSEDVTSLRRVTPDANHHSAGQALSSLGLGESIIIPLQAGDEHVGSLLLLDLLSSDGLEGVTDALSSLSGVIGLIFKNSILFRNLDTLVEDRTADLEQEISVRKKTEESLRRYQHIVSSSTDMMALLDIDYTYLAANESYLKAFALTPEQLIGNSVSNVFGEEFFTTVIKPYADRCLAEEEVNYQSWFDFPVSGKCYMDSTYYPYISDDNKIIGFVVNRRDITERKQAEDERMILEARLMQAQKMESIGTLAGGIAHDFNNILAALLGYAEMAREDSPNGSTVVHDLDQVIEAGNRAKALVRQILTFSHQVDTECVSFLPVTLVKETLKMLRPTIPSTIEIIQDIDHHTSPLYADPTQINQIIMNLCTNAYHALEETGGKFGVSVREVQMKKDELSHEPEIEPGAFIQISVWDTGPGIPAGIVEKVFDPFFTTKETGKGTGMGLSIVHGIAKKYGGFTSIETQKGQGTKVHVFLPVAEKSAHTIDEPQVSSNNVTKKERILFVDDEVMLAEMGKVMLERLGYIVTVKNDSFEALDTFQNRAEQFDLVITDQTMPGMTGTDLSRRLLQIRPDIPIILCTGYSAIISEEKAKAIGIKGFAMKPISKKDLAVLIRKVLDD